MPQRGRDRTPAPRGARRLVPSLSWVALCVVVSGVLVYVYLALVARALPAGEYAGFGAYWSLSLLLGFGLFLPLETEIARLVHLGPGRGLPRGTLRVAAVLTLAGLLAVAAAIPLLLPTLGSAGLVVALAAVCLVSPGQFVLRGLLVGTGGYRSYGVVLLADAVLRVLGATVVVLLAGPAGPAALGWTLVAALALAHLPLLAWRLRRRPPAPPGVPRLAPGAVAHLVVGTVCAQTLLNAAPVLVTAGTAGRTAAAAFVAAFTLVRLPLFVAVPLQGALLPALVDAGSGPPRARARVVRRLLAAVGALAAAAAVVGALAGPPVVGLVFGERYEPAAADVAVLAAGSVVHLALLVAAQAVVADARHRDSALAWGAGLAVAAVVALVVPGTAGAAWAFAGGSAAALAWCAVVLTRRGTGAAPVPPVPAGSTGGAR
ncbi:MULTISPECIES: hypothetical protein [Geodermatophilus]|uniref:Membrane protein involved in the export of O-antigen and teichoic acid n=1 Tax=Geodermatophilus arenarius TaxID=1137990 RepID=A0ABV9LLU1_9ACTN